MAESSLPRREVHRPDDLEALAGAVLEPFSRVVGMIRFALSAGQALDHRILAVL